MTLTFSQHADSYAKKSLVQSEAFTGLLSMISLEGTEAILDLGCGPGHLTEMLRARTTGFVAGVDPSEQMISLAKALGMQDVEFSIGTAEQLSYEQKFDLVICNSAFQWFTDRGMAVQACFRALKPGGSMLVQAPGGREYCPVFVQAEQAAAAHAEIGPIFNRFKNPWFFLNTAREYADLFESAGFHVVTAEIKERAMRLTVDQSMKVFESGAAEAYLNPAYYENGFSSEYPDAFKGLLFSLLDSKSDSDGWIELGFKRIFLRADKPRFSER